MTLDTTTVAAVQATLDEMFPDGRHWAILELLTTVGCADGLQLQQATGLSRDELALALKKMPEAIPGLPPLFFQPREKIMRPGKRGAPPAVYCLGETGAALLRVHGHPDAHPCRLDEIVDVAHALAVLDVRLLAQRAQLPVLTEKRLPSGKSDSYLRPDNCVTLPDGSAALFEIEQFLTPQHIARATQSLQNKQRFIKSTVGKEISATVRMLFNLAKGKDFERTCRVWEQAARAVAQRCGGTLAFRLLAMPLVDFQTAPDWGEPPQFHRWRDLTAGQTNDGRPAIGSRPPAGLATEGAAYDKQQSVSSNKPSTLTSQPLARKLPAELRRFSGHESSLVLTALWEAFKEELAAHSGAVQRPDSALFEIVGVIYAASHDPSLTPLERAGYPHASLYLLRQYLRLQPALLKVLKQEIQRGAQAVRWNTITITHRMQVVSQKFLRYHGFGPDGLLLVRALSADWNAAEPQHFQVRVDIFDTAVVCEGVDAATAREFTRAAEETLAWVLTALFTYAEDLGLPRAPFW